MCGRKQASIIIIWTMREKSVSYTHLDVYKRQEYEYPAGARRQGSMWQLLMAMNECGLKNDALMDTFYDIVMERYRSNSDYAILVFHDRYDIPAKGSDGERQWAVSYTHLDVYKRQG